MRKSNIVLSHIRLDTPQKLERWKLNIKKLFRKVGKRQKEVAIEMSLLAQKQGEQVVHSSFISPLSRFCNGKGSAFPTWFQREEERLELFARAMGFSSTDPIWEVLESSLDYRSPPQKWHDGFPNLYCHVPLRLNGLKSDDITLQYIDLVDKLGHIYLIGPMGSGKKTAAKEIQEKLRQHSIELSIQHEIHSIPSIICLEQKPHHIRNQDIVIEMSKWGLDEIEFLISFFQKENLDVFALQYWYSKIQENKNWLPFDCRPQTIIALCSYLLNLPQRELPKKPKQLRFLLLSKTIEHSVSSKMRHLSFDDITLLCAKAFFLSNATWRLSHSQIRDLFQHFSSNNTVDENIYHQLEELIHCSSTRRKELVLQLQETLLPNVDVQIEVLVQSGFLTQIDDEYSFSDPLTATSLAIWGFTGLTEFPIWKCMLVENSFALLEEFLLLNEDLQSHQLKYWQEQCPPHFAYEFNWILLFIVDKHIPLAPQFIQQAWASCLMGMSRQLFLSPQKNQKRTNLLHRISKTYSHVLPLLPNFDVINQLCPPQVAAIFQNWIVPQVVDFRKLSPFQFPPQSIQEMETFLGNDVHMLWQVLDLWASQGHVQSQRLLSEGVKYSKWSSIPLLTRMMYCGIKPLTHQSKQALQLMILEGYTENQSHFEQFIVRIEPHNLLDLILRFFEPLHICQQFQIQPQTELISFSLCVIRHLKQFSPIQDSFDVLLDFIHQEKIIKRGRIKHSNKSILVSISEQDLLLHIVSILYQIGKIAYELQIKEPIYKLFEYTKERNLSSQNEIASFLITNHDDWFVQKWIDGFELEQFRENLASNADLLKKTWQQDEEDKRKVDILMISCLHDPIPNWVISIARKELEYQGNWPNWLSPYRRDTLSLIHFGYEKVSIEYRLWWAFQLHRHKPFCSEIAQTLQYWLLEEQLPFRDCPAEASKDIFSTQMPIFTSQELLRLLQDFSRQKSKTLPPWFFSGIIRLWKICNYENNPQTLIVGKICHDVGLTKKLFDGDWMSSNGTLLRWLTEQWIDTHKLEEIKFHMKREDTVGILIRDHLLYNNDPEAILYLENLFLETGDSIALRKLVVIANYEPLPLLKKLLLRQPTWKKLMIQVANNMVPLSKHSVELQCWIRRISL